MQNYQTHPKRKKPSKKSVLRHWTPWLIEQNKADSKEEAEEMFCFACGMMYPLQLAHINSRCYNKEGWEGSEIDSEHNLHLLCETCHKASEFFEGEKYFAWLKIWTYMDRAMYLAAKRGVPLYYIFISPNRDEFLSKIFINFGNEE